MISVTLRFSDGDLVTVKIPPHVFEMWRSGEMRKNLQKLEIVIEKYERGEL